MATGSSGSSKSKYQSRTSTSAAKRRNSSVANKPIVKMVRRQSVAGARNTFRANRNKIYNF